MVFENKQFVANFLNDPVGETFHSDATVFNYFLAELEKNILAEKIDLKDKDKVINAIAEIKEDNLLAVIKNNFETLSKELKDLERILTNTPIQDKKEKLETALGSIRKRKNECESELAKEKSSADSFRNSVIKKKTELEEQIVIIAGGKVTLEISDF